jgi:hypothetical protein
LVPFGVLSSNESLDDFSFGIVESKLEVSWSLGRRKDAAAGGQVR